MNIMQSLLKVGNTSGVHNAVHTVVS